MGTAYLLRLVVSYHVGYRHNVVAPGNLTLCNHGNVLFCIVKHYVLNKQYGKRSYIISFEIKYDQL